MSSVRVLSVWGFAMMLLPAVGTARAADKQLSEAIVGKWDIHQFHDGKEVDKKDHIDINADGTYHWAMMGMSKKGRSGKYELKGDTLYLKEADGSALVWKGLKVNGQKITRETGASRREEWEPAK